MCTYIVQTQSTGSILKAQPQSERKHNRHDSLKDPCVDGHPLPSHWVDIVGFRPVPEYLKRYCHNIARHLGVEGETEVIEEKQRPAINMKKRRKVTSF